MEQGRTASWLLKLIIRSFRCSFAGTKDMYIYISFFVHSCFQLPWRETIGYISRGDPTFINLDRR